MLVKQKIELSKYTAAYWQIGSGFPIIFLHGFLGESSTWQALIPSLAKSFNCLALDMLGFGESAKPKLKYEISHQVNFVLEFVQAMGWQEFYVVGYSYGGWTAAAIAIALQKNSQPKNSQFPNLKKLILIAPAGIRDDSFVGKYNYMRPLLWETFLVDWILKIIAPLFWLSGQQSQFETICTARRELSAQPVAKSFIVDRLRPEDAIDTVEQEIEQILVPTLIIAAAQDQTIPLWHCQTYRDRIPDAQLEILPNAGHDLIQTHLPQIQKLLLEFLA